jgi:hypothetical protein
MTDKINLYVHSSYSEKDETTTNLKVFVPSGLIKSYGKGYFTLAITSFYSVNTLYQMDGTYSDFNIINRDISSNIFKYIFFSFVDCVSNPNVYYRRNKLITLLNVYFSVTYYKMKDLFLFTRRKAVDVSNNKSI